MSSFIDATHILQCYLYYWFLGGRGWEVGKRKDEDIPEGICSSTLNSSVNLKFLLTRDISNTKTISIHIISAVEQQC